MEIWGEVIWGRLLSSDAMVMVALGLFEAAFFVWLVLGVRRRDGLVEDSQRLAERDRSGRRQLPRPLT